MLPERLPPQSIDAEQAALGAGLISRSAAEGLVELERDDFYLEAHRKVFDVMLTLLHKDQPVDTLTVPEELKRRGQLVAVGGVDYVLALAESVPTAAHWQYYSRIVLGKGTLRRLINACGEITEDCHGQPDDLEAFTASVERRIQQVTACRGTSKARTLREPVQKLAERIIDAQSGECPPPGTPTGFRSLTEAWGGKGLRLRQGQLWVVGGRPSMGKSSFCLQMLLRLAAGGYPVLMVSLEMSDDQLVERAATLATPCDIGAALSGPLDAASFQRLSRTLGKLGDLPFYLDTTAASVAAVRTQCREIQRETGSAPEVIVVDYLQRMGGGRGENRNQELDYLAREFKTLARDLGATVILVSQLSRNVERRENKRPLMSDLRESGGIEAEADVVLFPFRPDYYRKDAPDAEADLPSGLERAEFLVEKHRMGNTGVIYTTWSTAFGGFEMSDPYHGDDQAPQAEQSEMFSDYDLGEPAPTFGDD